MASAFERPSPDVLASRSQRFKAEAKIVRSLPAPKKVMAWTGGKVTSNKGEALAKFLARKAELGERVDPKLLKNAVRATAEAAQVAVDPEAPPSPTDADARRKKKAARSAAKAAKKMLKVEKKALKRASEELSKAAKKNLKRSQKRAEKKRAF
jgi:hypothetical protein